MLRSMTGFAHITQNLKINNHDNHQATLQINLEAKTVNSRYFEAMIKLPHILSMLENKISLQAKKTLLRGKLFVFCSISSSDTSLEKISVSMPTAKQYYEGIQQISAEIGIDNQIRTIELLRLPGVLSIEKIEVNQDLEKQVLETTATLFDKLDKSRYTEGMQLKKNIELHIANSKSAIEKIKRRNKTILKNLGAKVVELEAQISNSDDQNISEKLAQAKHELDKADLTEEIIRANSHLESCIKNINSNEPEKGKFLDFLCQELFREVNTICSKSSDLKTIQLAIQIKVDLEKIKEQAQNIV